MFIVGAALFINGAIKMLIVGAALFIYGCTVYKWAPYLSADSWCSTIDSWGTTFSVEYSTHEG